MTPHAFAFVDAPLDRADAVRGDPDALAAAWRNARVVLVDADGHAGADDAGAPFWVEGAALAPGPGVALFLGLQEGQPWFALPAETTDVRAPRQVDLRTAAAEWPAFASTLFAQARAMLHWRARNAYCGVCGGALAFVHGGWQARCTQCNAEHYPRTDPAVIVAVGQGECLLLGRQAAWPEGRYSTLAGFVEPGETLEQAVAREVLEESGVRVRSARYLASQPWPFPGSLMLGFVADAQPDAPVAGDELQDVRWFDHDQVGRALRGEVRAGDPRLSPAISISRWLVERWHAGVR